ncbi:MAG: hypothetical protein Q8M22_00755 [Actinomycetota bacterium]|nr:hypothetical protein [Actinomycetota bacterium]
MKRSTTLLLGAALATTVLVACGDDSDSGSSDGDYCARIAAYRAEADGLDAVFESDSPDAAAMEDAFTTMQTMVNDLKDGAPSEIADDVSTMAGAIDSVVAIFDQYDWDFMQLAAAPEFAQLQEDLAGPEMQAASDRLTEYSETTCGIPSES